MGWQCWKSYNKWSHNILVSHVILYQCANTSMLYCNNPTSLTTPLHVTWMKRPSSLVSSLCSIGDFTFNISSQFAYIYCHFTIHMPTWRTEIKCAKLTFHLFRLGYSNILTRRRKTILKVTSSSLMLKLSRYQFNKTCIQLQVRTSVLEKWGGKGLSFYKGFVQNVLAAL